MCEPQVGVDPASLDDDALRELVLGLEAEADRVEACRLAVLAEWDARGLWSADGAWSGAGWLAARGSKHRAALAGLLRDGRALRGMAVTAGAVAAGRLAPAKARLLCRAVNERTREAFVRDEALLVDTLAGLTVEEAARAVRFWAAQADQDGPEPGDRDRNRLWLSQSFGGRWQLKADLDAESGTIVHGVLSGLVDESYRRLRDQRVEAAGQGPRLRAEALVEMARLATAAPDTARPARPLLWVIAGADQLEGGQGICELPGFGPLSALAAQRLACDCDWGRIITDPDGRVRLELGRTSRTASANQRRVLALRDGGCRFPGCGRPAVGCEAHHILQWEHGGPTDLDNLASRQTDPIENRRRWAQGGTVREHDRPGERLST